MRVNRCCGEDGTRAVLDRATRKVEEVGWKQSILRSRGAYTLCLVVVPCGFGSFVWYRFEMYTSREGYSLSRMFIACFPFFARVIMLVEVATKSHQSG